MILESVKKHLSKNRINELTNDYVQKKYDSFDDSNPFDKKKKESSKETFSKYLDSSLKEFAKSKGFSISYDPDKKIIKILKGSISSGKTNNTLVLINLNNGGLYEKEGMDSWTSLDWKVLKKLSDMVSKSFKIKLDSEMRSYEDFLKDQKPFVGTKNDEAERLQKRFGNK